MSPGRLKVRETGRQSGLQIVGIGRLAHHAVSLAGLRENRFRPARIFHPSRGCEREFTANFSRG